MTGMNALLDTLDYFGFIFLELAALFLSICTAISLILQYKHRCINFYINKFQIPSPTLRGVAKRPLILADMTFLTRLRSSEIPPLIVLAA